MWRFAMTRQIFISSVQKELQDFRDAVYDYVTSDPLLKQFFNVFQFEKLPAADRAADDVYLEEVAKTDIYLGLFANEYGWEDDNGISPTHREFIAATDNGVYRLIYIVDLDGDQHPKMKALINEAGDQLIRRRVHDISGLLDALYHSLVEYLGDKGLINTAPFDNRACAESTLPDISDERIKWFVKRARAERGFPLGPESTAEQTLTHLNQLSDGVPTSAAMLLFGEQPQKFLPVAEIKCAHHHGTTVQKPIPDYKVFGAPQFDHDGTEFVVSVPRHDRKRFEALGLNDRQIEIMAQVRIGGRITNSEVQTLTGSGRKTASRDLDELVEQGLLERKGKGRGTHYVEAK
ncbi:MAG: DUF4062 domain-containing protein [Planctomycetota bacterium]